MISYFLKMYLRNDNPPNLGKTVSYTLHRGTKCIHTTIMTKIVNINDVSMILYTEHRRKNDDTFFHAPTWLISKLHQAQ